MPATAISTEIGSQVQRPIATVIVGGMFIGHIMLRLVVPVLKIAFLGSKPIKASSSSST